MDLELFLGQSETQNNNAQSEPIIEEMDWTVAETINDKSSILHVT